MCHLVNIDEDLLKQAFIILICMKIWATSCLGVAEDMGTWTKTRLCWSHIAIQHTSSVCCFTLRHGLQIKCAAHCSRPWDERPFQSSLNISELSIQPEDNRLQIEKRAATAAGAQNQHPSEKQYFLLFSPGQSGFCLMLSSNPASVVVAPPSTTDSQPVWMSDERKYQFH